MIFNRSSILRHSVAISALFLGLAASARAADVGYSAALRDAEAVAGQRPGLSVMRVSGHSMLPYFGDDAVIVTKKIDAARLRIGMIVVYVNRFGERVAHRIIAKVDGGWQVKGYNNDRPDSTVVNGGNLLGVVYATFYSAGRAPVKLASADFPPVETVYAAPAR